MNTENAIHTMIEYDERPQFVGASEQRRGKLAELCGLRRTIPSVKRYLPVEEVVDDNDEGEYEEMMHLIDMHMLTDTDDDEQSHNSEVEDPEWSADVISESESEDQSELCEDS